MLIKVYIASPFFTPEQIKEVEAIEASVERIGMWAFSPRQGESSIIYSKLLSGEIELEPEMVDSFTSLLQGKIFSSNVDEIRTSDSMVANVRGYDSGTLFEIGIGLAHNKTVETVFRKPSDNEYTINGLRNAFAFDSAIEARTDKLLVLDSWEAGINFSSLGYQIVTHEKAYSMKLEKFKEIRVVAETKDYKGLSKVILGYAWAHGVKVKYYDLSSRKSNIMLSKSVDIFLVDEIPEIKCLNDIGFMDRALPFFGSTTDD